MPTRQLTMFSNIPEEIHLPSLEAPQTKVHGNLIQHIIFQNQKIRVTSVSEVQISAKRKADLCHLENGQNIILTATKNVELPEGVDGVLLVNEEGKPTKWLQHRLLDDYEHHIESKGYTSCSDDIYSSWNDSFTFKAELRNGNDEIVEMGLRPPQIGGLHAIGAHWSLEQSPATIVMPTGTGKTETMLAATAAFIRKPVLVVVPSKVLRDQTANKFKSFGLLRYLGSLNEKASNPIVGILKHRINTQEDLDIFRRCNVIVSTMALLSDKSASPHLSDLAEIIDTLIVDEAHHIAAKGWSAFREQFIKKGKRVLQFTATPFRRDGQLVDGKVIYSYPLAKAQKEGYFKGITFDPVYEIDQEDADTAIAECAVKKLREDIDAGFNHLMMARCNTIERAKSIFRIYETIAPDFAPILVHSEARKASEDLHKLLAGESRIAVCVNMLGEGFDLPQLKIAAIHDTHKSLAVILQFTGRFTRTTNDKIGDATIIANIANQDVSSSLERLYSEDADWNQLLNEFSSEAMQQHRNLIEFLNASERLEDSNTGNEIDISHNLLRPKLSTLLYRADTFTPKMFYEGLPKNMSVHRVWLHSPSNTLFFVTRTEPSVQWTRSREIHDRQWDLFILHFDDEQKILYLGSSDTSSPYSKLAEAVGATEQIKGDNMFRALGNINRLIFQNVGVQKHGRRNLRFAMYTGADVAEALSLAERAGSVKSNLSGTGWENGYPVAIGCSLKGRIWLRSQKSIPEFIEWSEKVGAKILDDTISTDNIIENVLIPEDIDQLPPANVLCVEWPYELLKRPEERILLINGEDEIPLSMFDISPLDIDLGTNTITFKICSEDLETDLALSLDSEKGYRISRQAGTAFTIKIGKKSQPLERFFQDYPPLIQFVDMTELDGNLLIKPKNPQDLVFPEARFEAWNWDGIDIQKESYWKNGDIRTDSIQWHTAQHFINGEFDIVFDDDAAGEAADLVCMKEEDDHIRLALAHCKFSGGADAGERVKDVVEVCSQAVRSAKWKWKFKDLCQHLKSRDKRLSSAARPSRFFKGKPNDLNRMQKLSRIKEIKLEILIVQPGLSQDNYTDDQSAILAAAYNYLKETVGTELDIICSN